MAWRALQSRHLNGMDYDAPSATLTLQFTNGAVYRYNGVPQTTADTLSQSPSPGSYFHEKIRGRYSESKLLDGMTKRGNRSTRRY